MTTPASSKPNPPPAQKPLLHIHPTATIADKANISGTHPITISASAIIHPFARLDSSVGPIEIGEAAVVWEKAVVGAPPTVSTPNSIEVNEPATTVIGAYASIHPHSAVHVGSSIGVHASVEVGAVVGAGAVLSEYVKLSPCVEIAAGVEIKSFMTVFWVGDKQMERVNTTTREQGEVRELYEKGSEKEIALLKRVVRGGGKWTS